MESFTLQFQGIRNQQLLLALLAAVAAILACFGVWQLARRRWRDGILCLAGAMGPLVIPALAGNALTQYAAGNRRRGNSSLLGAFVAAAGAALAGAFFLTAGKSNSALWMAMLGLEVAIAVGLFYSAVYAYLGTGRMAVLMALRCMAIVTLLLVLFKPALSVNPQFLHNKPYLPILVDRSASMATSDEANSATRYSQAVGMLSSQQAQIEKHFHPLYYHFAEKPQMAESVAALGQLKPAGDGTAGTNIAAAIREGARQGQGNMPGMLLLSDGINNGSDNIMDAVIESGVPIYALGLGSAAEGTAGARNVELAGVSAPMEAIKNNITAISVSFKVTGLPNTTTQVQLFEEGGQTPVAQASALADKPSQTLTVDLKWTPKDRPAPAGEQAASGASAATGGRSEVRKLRVVIPANPAESTTDDNNMDLHVLVTEPKIRVLYVEGSLRSEYKFLKRILDSDANVQFMGLIQFAKNRFEAQGSIGGQRPGGLPTTDEDFRLFDVIILGDLDRSYLTNEQMARIRKFVNDGGGLLMIGGQHTLASGGYGGTDIETVLPVILGPRAAVKAAQEDNPFLPRLTAAGQGHPIFESIADFFPGPGGPAANTQIKLPNLLGCAAVEGAKPNAAVLAVHPDRAGKDGNALVVLAVQNFGAGRSAVFTADTTWQWYTYLQFQGRGSDSPYHKFWGQMVRWLANAQTKSRQAAPAAVLRLDRAYLQAGQSVKFAARVQDQKGQVSDSATVFCTVAPTGDPAAAPETVPLASGRGPGIFDGTTVIRKEGQYTVKLAALDASGKTLGEDQLTLKAAPHSAEMDRLARDEPMLRAVAERSDGRYADIFGLPDVVRQIVEREKGRAMSSTAGRTFCLYNFTVLFLAFVALLTGEWMLRRSWQLH